jgi:hypothetical protein
VTENRDEARILERVLAVAGAAEPLTLSQEAARDITRRAAEIAAVHGDDARRHRTALFGAAGVVVAAALLLVAWRSAQVSAPAGLPAAPTAAAPMELSLPTGDRLTVVEGSKFELLAVRAEERRVSLVRGSMLFDVTPLGDAARFEVTTKHLTVRVRGTVFSVHTNDGGTTVRVYEGRVEVDEGGALHVLGADQAWTSGSGPDVEARLATAGAEAARARSEASRAVARAERVAPRPDTLVDPALPALELAEARRAPPHIAPETPAGLGAPDETSSREETPTDASRLIAAGDAAVALRMARRALAEGQDRVRWGFVEADALRALRRFPEAADAFDRVAAVAEGTSKRGAGYRAAVIRRGDLHDPRGALASLDASGADADGSPFAERALVLRARALHESGSSEEAREVVRRYRATYPESSASAWMAEISAPE